MNGIFINQNVCSIYVPAREDPCPVRADLFYLAVELHCDLLYYLVQWFCFCGLIKNKKTKSQMQMTHLLKL